MLKAKSLAACAAFATVILVATTGGARAQGLETRYRVAVLDFDTSRAKTADGQKWGSEVADLLTALLSTQPHLELVERVQLEKAVAEHKLGLTGLVADEDQVKLGRIVGAQFLVTGRMFPIDRDICLVAKVIGVETSRMTAELVQGPMGEDLSPLVSQLAFKLGDAIQKKAPVLLPAKRVAPDVVADIRKRLGKGGLPSVLVSVSESHASRRTSAGVDPAAASEFTYILRSCGFDVTEEESAKRAVAEWAKRFLRDTGAELPDSLPTADLILVGQGFSEFGARTGDLVTCVARLEVQAVDTRTGRVLAVGRKTARAVDLAEGIAAKSALQKAAASIASRLLPDAVAAWQKAHPHLERANRPAGAGAGAIDGVE